MALLGNHLFNAVQTSNQWRMERKLDQPTTLCITMMVPNDDNADISITLCIGQETAVPLIETFSLLPSWSASATHG